MNIPLTLKRIDPRANLVDSDDVRHRALCERIRYSEARQRYIAEGRTFNSVQQRLYEADCTRRNRKRVTNG